MPQAFSHQPALAAIAVASLLAACAIGDPAPGANRIDVTQGTVIDNITVINTRDGSSRPGMTLVLSQGRIERMLPTQPLRPLTAASGVTRVDGSGQYVVPGYLDMHTHAMPAPGQASSHWPVLLAHGITGVREMSGSPAQIERARQLNADSRAAGWMPPRCCRCRPIWSPAIRRWLRWWRWSASTRLRVQTSSS